MSKNYLMEEAQKVAKNMLETGVITAPVKSWRDGNTLFVSLDKKSIHFTQTFLLKEKRFFIGVQLEN